MELVLERRHAGQTDVEDVFPFYCLVGGCGQRGFCQGLEVQFGERSRQLVSELYLIRRSIILIVFIYLLVFAIDSLDILLGKVHNKFQQPSRDAPSIIMSIAQNSNKIRSLAELLHFFPKPLKALHNAFPIDSAAGLHVPGSFVLVQAHLLNDFDWPECGEIHFVGEDEDRALKHIGVADHTLEGFLCQLYPFSIG